jgi:hypothetical protein
MKAVGYVAIVSAPDIPLLIQIAMILTTCGRWVIYYSLMNLKYVFLLKIWPVHVPPCLIKYFQTDFVEVPLYGIDGFPTDVPSFQFTVHNHLYHTALYNLI